MTNKDFDKIIDKKILNLEDSIIDSNNSKILIKKLGIIAVINALIIKLIKPIYVMDIQYNEKKKKISYKLNIPYYIISILLSTFFVYFCLNLFYKRK